MPFFWSDRILAKVDAERKTYIKNTSREIGSRFETYFSWSSKTGPCIFLDQAKYRAKYSYLWYFTTGLRKTAIPVREKWKSTQPLHVPSGFTCIFLFDLSESCKYNTYVPLLPSPHEIKYSAVFFISWHFISFVCLIDTTQKFELDKMHGTKRLQLSYV